MADRTQIHFPPTFTTHFRSRTLSEGPSGIAVHRETRNLALPRTRLIGGLALCQVVNSGPIHLETLRHFIGIVRSIAAVLGLDHHFPGASADRHLIIHKSSRTRYHFIVDGQTRRICGGIQVEDLIGVFVRNRREGNTLHGLAIVDPTQQVVAGGQAPVRPAIGGRDQGGRISRKPLNGADPLVRVFVLPRQIDIAFPGLAIHKQMLMRHRMVAPLHIRG